MKLRQRRFSVILLKIFRYFPGSRARVGSAAEPRRHNSTPLHDYPRIFPGLILIYVAAVRCGVCLEAVELLDLDLVKNQKKIFRINLFRLISANGTRPTCYVLDNFQQRHVSSNITSKMNGYSQCLGYVSELPHPHLQPPPRPGLWQSSLLF